MVYCRSVLHHADPNWRSTQAAGGRDRCIRPIHAASTQGVDGAQSIQRAAMNVAAMLGWQAGERVGIDDRVRRLVHPEQIVRLKVGKKRPHLRGWQSSVAGDLSKGWRVT